MLTLPVTVKRFLSGAAIMTRRNKGTDDGKGSGSRPGRVELLGLADGRQWNRGYRRTRLMIETPAFSWGFLFQAHRPDCSSIGVRSGLLLFCLWCTPLLRAPFAKVRFQAARALIRLRGSLKNKCPDIAARAPAWRSLANPLVRCSSPRAAPPRLGMRGRSLPEPRPAGLCS